MLVGANQLLFSTAITCAVFLVVKLINKNLGRISPLSICAFTLISLTGYVFMGELDTNTLQIKLFASLLTIAITYVCLVSASAIKNKGLKYKFGYEESLCLVVAVAVFGVGLCNLTSPLIWKGLCALLVLLACYLLKAGISNVVACVLGISLAIYYGNIALVSVFLIWSVVCSAIMPFNRFASAVSIALCDLLIQTVFSIYAIYLLNDFLAVLLGCLVFCIIPTSPLTRLKDNLYSFRERHLVRQTINRNKLMLSNKLYELSGVFSDIKTAFCDLQKNQISIENAKVIISKQVLNSLCEKCEKNKNCSKDKSATKNDIEKLTDIGLAKGRLTLIDMPKHLGQNCARPSDLLYAVNKLLADYRGYCLDKKNSQIGRELLADEAQGVADMLKSLALESGTQLNFQNKTERKLCDALQRKGFVVSELLIYGEIERLSVSMIITMNEFSVPALEKVVSNTVGVDMMLCDKNNITDDKVYLVLKRKAPFDAVFGIAKATKDGSEKSGDTYSVANLSDYKFLVALSDGMGSGDNAERVSNTALSLIESFYKAGLSGNLILKTVNKILSINQEDTFTALDVSVIDLKTCKADFIKYGSPYGFIIGENGIKIIEGNSLPLGIVEELKPNVCTSDLSNDNMILLITDGISDAFGSVDQLIDFLRNVPALNPQSLADTVLNKAIDLNDGKPKDDMTALAVRLFKKNAV